MRIGCGFDIHRLVEGRRLVLGGVPIPYPRGLLGHSDGDVLLHAVADALLGASGLGDIGEMFPDTADETKDMDSAIIVQRVMAQVAQRGMRVENADVTVVAQEPRLSTHKAAIRERLATLLDVPFDRVSVKAKTAEQLGAIGRAEAIAAQAVVLLVENSLPRRP